MRFKPYWNDELRNQWSIVCVSEKTWLHYTGAKRNKRNLKEAYCIERKTFDKLNRKCKRRYQLQQQQNLEEKMNNINQRDFWKSIEKIGISNDRKRAIPLAVVDNNGSVTNDKMDILNK